MPVKFPPNCKPLFVNPKLFAELIRVVKDQLGHAVLRIVREVRDRNW